MADAQQVNPPGKFVTHRTIVGTPAAESTTLSDANFPPANALHCGRASTILVYYDDDSGGGGTLDIQVLIRDGINGIWLPRVAVTITGRIPLELDVFGANEVFLRIAAVSTPGDNTEIRAAIAQWVRGPTR